MEEENKVAEQVEATILKPLEAMDSCNAESPTTESQRTGESSHKSIQNEEIQCTDEEAPSDNQSKPEETAIGSGSNPKEQVTEMECDKAIDNSTVDKDVDADVDTEAAANVENANDIDKPVENTEVAENPSPKSDSNGADVPNEEVDPMEKNQRIDGSDIKEADPLMKDSECQADETLGDDSKKQTESSEQAEDNGQMEVSSQTDRIMLSVKPAVELMENFVDVTNEEENLPTEPMDFDPIETSNDGELFNGRDAETILAEDDAEHAAENNASETDKTDVYVIIHANSTEKTACAICGTEAVPEYLAHKQDLSERFCTAACLEKFKEKHAGNYVERILRLRVFASQGTTSPKEAPRATLASGVIDDPNADLLRRCGCCNSVIDEKSYLSWQVQDYCDEGCLHTFQETINQDCAKCLQPVPENLLGKYCVRFGMTVMQFCKTSCLISYKRVRKLCVHCQEEISSDEFGTSCSKRCADTGRSAEPEPKETSLCSVCGQVKEVELKVRDSAKMDCICSDRCFVAYKFVNKVELVKCEVCPTTFERKPGDPSFYEIAKQHILCSKECQKVYLITHRVIVNCSICLVKKYDFDMIRFIQKQQSTFVCSLNCLSTHFESEYTQKARHFEPNVKNLMAIARDADYRYDGKRLRDIIDTFINAGKIAIQKVIVTKPRAIPRQRNKAVMCKPRMLTKAIQCRTKERTIQVQTDDTYTRWIPIPVPIFVPTPLHMHVLPVPLLTPIPLPIIVPIFILTGRKSIKGIQKEIQKIKSRIPADPLEAEILMMADMAAGVKRNEPTSDSDEDDTNKMLDTSAIPMDAASTSFSDDVLSMAFKMANEYTEPLDLESEVDNSSRMLAAGRRQIYKPRGRPQRMMDLVKPDENLALKFTFGVNAWKQWASMKNHELQKMKNPKFIKLDLLQLSAEDLCYCLCQFVKEVRKPNGGSYASDTIYYLCLGIQLYLYENGRIDNLFCDTYYEKFTDTFNEICLSFCQLYRDNQYIVTRVEEEHLWESKQLGAHSPLVLLNTLLFFNTKHFNLTTVEEHLQLSFSHIMKHWKRNANAPNQRNVLLRFYPPSKGAWGKRKVYEQQECLENPLRCPVRLYEFFLSKCPESVKTRNDVFYLQPERSCVPDSPVWYSTSALDRCHLEKMLNRMKLIKEISMAILAT